MDKVIAYRMRRNRRLARRGYRVDADDDGRWITTHESHQKVFINGEGVATKGNKHVTSLMNGEKEVKASTTPKSEKPKKMNKPEIRKRLEEIENLIHENDMSDAGSDRWNSAYHKKDAELRAERDRLQRMLNSKGVGKKKTEKKIEKALERFSSYNGLNEAEQKYSNIFGYTDDEFKRLKDRTWYKPSEKDKEDFAKMIKDGATEEEIFKEMDKRSRKIIENERNERRRKEKEEEEKREREAETEEEKKRREEEKKRREENAKEADKRLYDLLQKTLGQQAENRRRLTDALEKKRLGKPLSDEESALVQKHNGQTSDEFSGAMKTWGDRGSNGTSPETFYKAFKARYPFGTLYVDKKPKDGGLPGITVRFGVGGKEYTYRGDLRHMVDRLKLADWMKRVS